MINVLVKFDTAFNIDEECWAQLVPEFFNDEGEFIATEDDVRQWVDTHQDDIYNFYQGDLQSIADQGDFNMETEFYK